MLHMNKNSILYITKSSEDLVKLFKDDEEIKIEIVHNAESALEKILNGLECSLIAVDDSSCIDSEIEILQ